MRLRVLPLVLFVGTALFTLRVGDMWQEASLTAGQPSAAQTVAPSTAAPAATAQTPPAAGGQTTTNGSGTAGSGGPVPAAAPSPPPVAAAGPAQQSLLGQPQTAAANAPDTAGASGGTGAPGADNTANNPFNYSDSEIELLQSLAKRRDELDKRAAALDQREALLTAAEQRMDQKLAELKAVQQQIQTAVSQQQAAQDAQYNSLVKTYEAMKPKDAAAIFDTLDVDVLLELTARMNARKLAPVLAAMDPAKAQQLTVELAARKAPTIQ